MLSRTSRFPEYHQSSLKSFGERIEKRFFDLRYTSNDEQRTYEIECDASQVKRWRERTAKNLTSSLTPGSMLILSDGREVAVTDDFEDRPNGSILQMGKSLYLVSDGWIWNKRGIKMLSAVRSENYSKVGQAMIGHFGPTKWFHEDMLELRR